MRQNGFTVTWWVLNTATNETVAICMTKADADFISEVYLTQRGIKCVVKPSYSR